VAGGGILAAIAGKELLDHEEHKYFEEGREEGFDQGLDQGFNDGE
jgi:hypothetical protein